LQRSKAESLSGGERQMLAIARALMVPAKLILLDEPFEGLAPTIVKEVMDALAHLRGRVAMVIVEHHAETVLPLVDRAYVLVNGRVAFEGTARSLEEDPELQSRLLGVVPKEAGDLTAIEHDFPPDSQHADGTGRYLMSSDSRQRRG
jgi:ABC-type branched-subunit amino acid transport system ATPase component